MITDEFINSKVLVRSNDFKEPLTSGTLVGFQEVSKANNTLPVVKMDNDDKEYLCMSVVLPYDEDLKAFLESLSNERQWDLVCKISKLTKYIQRLDMISTKRTPKESL